MCRFGECMHCFCGLEILSCSRTVIKANNFITVDFKKITAQFKDDVCKRDIQSQKKYKTKVGNL